MSDTTFTLQQNIFKDPYPSISVVSLDESRLVSSPQILQQFLATAGDGAIGLAPVYGVKCVLTILALSTLSQCIVVRFPSPKGKKKKKKRAANSTTPHLTRGRHVLENDILLHPERRKYAFRMDRLSTSLYLDQNIRITGGVDLLSTSDAGRRSLDAVMTALGGEITLHKSNLMTLFKHEETIKTSSRDVALQAWAACRAANLPSLAVILSEIPIVDTLSMKKQVYFVPSYMTLAFILTCVFLTAAALLSADSQRC